MANEIIYLPGLNGIRAIAAIAVVIAHITLNLEAFGLDPHLFGTYSDGTPRTLDLAGYGVSMFFTLSGFLITFLLCKEKEKQQVDIKKFYLRRILRIWPIYYAYFAICIIVYMVFNLEYNLNSIFYYLFYGANIPFIIGGTLPFLAHYWSLGVEEQFYMFWPWLGKLRERKLLIIACTIIVVLIATKIILHIFIPNTVLELTIHVTRFHCMLIGGVGAILYYKKNKLFIKITTHRLAQLISWVILLLVAINRFHVASFLDNEILSGITAIIIIGQITTSSIFSLERVFLDYLGKISYGIYVVHPLIIFFFSKILKDITMYKEVNYLIVYTLIISTTIIVSHMSYEYFEKPFLKLKSRKYSVVKSSGQKIPIDNTAEERAT
jgi:peptidoglycan/LPS O-acetylase OafA/YrhL